MNAAGAQSVQRLAKDQTAPGSNAGGDEIFRAVQTGPEAHPPSCTLGTGSFPWIKPAEESC